MIINNYNIPAEKAKAKVLLANIGSLIAKKELYGPVDTSELDILYMDSSYISLAIDYLSSLQKDLLITYEEGLINVISALNTLNIKYN